MPLEQASDRRYSWPAGSSGGPAALSRPSDIHMVVAGEADIYNHNLSPFNAGVWIVANTRLGRALMARWAGVRREKDPASSPKTVSGYSRNP